MFKPIDRKSQSLIMRNLRFYREKAGLSQAVLAKRAGVSQVSLSTYETGRAVPCEPNRLRLAAALHEALDGVLPSPPEGPSPRPPHPKRSGPGLQPSGLAKFPCPRCGAFNHFRIEPNVSGLSFKCPACSRSFILTEIGNG